MRNPCVAGQFYPSNPQALTTQLETFCTVPKDKTIRQVKAVVAPHAGYIYSGQLASQTLSTTKVPESVVIIGPNHTGKGKEVALSSTSWDMVCGEVGVNSFLIDLLMTEPTPFTIDEEAHKFEHSLEVQIPILQYLQKNLKIVPIVISRISYDLCQVVAQSLAKAINEYSQDVLIVASSDMNHYESRGVTEKKDSLALEAIRTFDPHALYETVQQYRISMCGVIPVVIAMLASRELGAESTEITGYTDSGYVSGDTNQVVSYAGIHIL